MPRSVFVPGLAGKKVSQPMAFLVRLKINKCDIIHLVNRDQLTTRRGQITGERRCRIIATMMRSNELI